MVVVDKEVLSSVSFQNNFRLNQTDNYLLAAAFLLTASTFTNTLNNILFNYNNFFLDIDQKTNNSLVNIRIFDQISYM